jgi:hypothetical protein
MPYPSSAALFQVSITFDDLAEDNRHIIAVGLFREGPSREPVPNNYLTCGSRKKDYDGT